MGKLFRLGEQRGWGLAEFSQVQFESDIPGMCRAVYEWLGIPRALKAIRSSGTTASDEVARQLKF